MNTHIFCKGGLALGAGVLLGVIGAVLLSRANIDLKKKAASLLSHGMDIKDKASGLIATAKDNVEDIATEARNEQKKRKAKTALS